jgi:integrase
MDAGGKTKDQEAQAPLPARGADRRRGASVDGRVRPLHPHGGAEPSPDRSALPQRLAHQRGAGAVSKDIDFASGAIRVLHGKGDKSRTVGIDPGAIEYVQNWLAVRQRWEMTGCHPIFCTRSGQQLGEGYIRRLFPSLGRIAGIHKRVHPHGLRHTHAAQLREEGIDVGIISKQLGHVSIATTARYLDHIAPAALLQVMSQRSW